MEYDVAPLNGKVISSKATASDYGPEAVNELLDTLSQLRTQLAEVRAENDALRLAQTYGDKLSFRRTTKGAISIYGFGRWPVTLYAGQIVHLIAQIEDLKHLTLDNWDKLSHKDGEVKPTWTVDATKVTKGIILGEPKVEDEKAVEQAGKIS